jgi:tRNA (guanosine-2'-O-)-methyltransferase
MASTSSRPSERVSAAILLAALVACASPVSLQPSAPQGGEAAPTGSSFAPPPGIALDTTCVTSAHELCFDAVDNNCNGLLEEGCGVNSGAIQLAAAWAEEEADVDLSLTDPSGELVKAGVLTASGLAKDRDCPGSERRCRGQNMENIFLEPGAEPPRGVYRASVRLEKTHGARLPIKVRIGARVGPKVYGFSVELTAQGEEKNFQFSL